MQGQGDQFNQGGDGRTATGLHSLRHTHATQLLKLNISPKIVSERPGHSTIAITLDTYSHVLPGMQEAAVAEYEVLLRASLDAEAKR